MNSDSFIDFEQRRVLLTGASSGIGRAIAIELVRRGARVLITGRDEARLRETAELAGAGAVDVVAGDLMQLDALAGEIRARVAASGRLHGFCHCAGIVETLPVNAFRRDSFEKLMHVNVAAALELAKVVIRRDCLEDAGGSLLFVSSIYGSVGMAGQVSYSATKGALLAAARAMAVELARRKIRVNTLSPGMVLTPMVEQSLAKLEPARRQALESLHPLGPGRPEDVARAAAFLLAPQNPWITGTDFVIDGGYTAQ